MYWTVYLSWKRSNSESRPTDRTKAYRSMNGIPNLSFCCTPSPCMENDQQMENAMPKRWKHCNDACKCAARAAVHTVRNVSSEKMPLYNLSLTDYFIGDWYHSSEFRWTHITSTSFVLQYPCCIMMRMLMLFSFTVHTRTNNAEKKLINDDDDEEGDSKSRKKKNVLKLPIFYRI